MSPSTRRPTGTPDGGQFTGVVHAESEIRLEDLSRCTGCDGTGASRGSDCVSCGGVGSLDLDAWERQTNVEDLATTACPACDEGLTESFEICGRCDGAGTVQDYSHAQ